MTVLVGFLTILLFICHLFFVKVGPRKFILLLTTVSVIKFNFACSLLKYWCSSLVCLLISLHRSIMSLAYLYQYMILWVCSLLSWLNSLILHFIHLITKKLVCIEEYAKL